MHIRKTLMLALAALLAVSMVACGGAPKQAPALETTAAAATTTTAAAETTTEATTAAAAETTTAAATEAATTTTAATTTAATATIAAATTVAAEERATAAQNPNLDISTRVNLVNYHMGDPPEDLKRVNDLVNEILLAELNCTVEFLYTTWADYATRYSLLLTSGEQVDMIYSANWLTDRDYAKRNAFYFLDDLLPKYAPGLLKHIGQPYWDDATENGYIYTIPCTWPEYIDGGLCYRADFCKKYNLPRPDTFENLEAYMLGVQENEPGLALTYEGGQTGPHYTGFNGVDIVNLESFRYSITDCGLLIGYSADNSGKFSYRDVINYYDSDVIVNDMKLMKRFMELGFWSRNALSNPVDDADGAFKVGQCAARFSGQNPNKWGGYAGEAAISNPDWEFDYITYKGQYGYSTPVQPTQNGTAFPLAGKNVERALAVVERITLGKDLHDLTHFGIEGEHYTRDGEIYIPAANNKNFPMDSMNAWNWRNYNFWIAAESYNLIKEANKGYDKLIPLYPLSFAPDNALVETERAALAQIRNQFLAPIAAGLSTDIEGDLKTFLDKANAAGLQKVQQAFIDQWLAYCDMRGLQ